MGTRVMTGVTGLVITFALLGATDPVQDAPTDPAVVERLAEGMRNPDVDTRRMAAKGVFESEKGVQIALLEQMGEMLRAEKDGQVRLFLFDILTDLGPDAEPAVDALLHTLRTDYGGQGKEETHQDYRAALAMAAIGKPAVDGLRALLTEPEIKLNVRAEAIMALGRIGPEAETAIPELVTFLGHEKERLREEAMEGLGAIGAAAVGPLVQATRSDETNVRRGAIVAIGRTATEEPAAVSMVVEGTEDQAAEVRVAAITALSRMGVADAVLQPILDRGLEDENEEVVRSVIAVLVERPALLLDATAGLKRVVGLGDSARARLAGFALARSGDEAIPELLDTLSEPESPVEVVAESMVVLGRSAVPRLKTALEDGNPRVRRAAALALGSIRPLAPEIPGRLAAGLRDPDAEVRGAFLVALGTLGPRARGVAAEIRPLMQDQDAATRRQAVEVFFLCAARDEQLLQDLVGRIDDPDARVQVAVLDHLRALGPLSRKALPEVTGRLESSETDVRRAAAALIASHGPAAAEAVPALVSLLENPSPEVWVLAIETLARIGRPASPAFERLEGLMDSEHTQVREAVFQALGSLGLETDSLLPSLAKGLRDSDANVRGAAMRSIQQLGPQGALLLPDLIRLAGNPDERRGVERALRRFERRGPDPRSVPELVELLAHEDEAVRLLAIRFLGLGGSRAGEAIPALEDLREDPSEAVREQVKEALAKIQQAEAGTDENPDEG